MRHAAAFVSSVSDGEFRDQVLKRLGKGAVEYTDQSFKRADDDLLAEIQEELADVVGWVSILATRRALLPNSHEDHVDIELVEVSAQAEILWKRLKALRS